MQGIDRDVESQLSKTAPQRARRRLLEPLAGGSIRAQELVLVPLNLALLAGVALFHALFAPALGLPPPLFFGVVLSRFALQIGELGWLVAAAPSERALRRYAHATIWVNLGFAFALSRLGGLVDSHYVVLMLVPVVAAAFRYRPAGIALVVAAAGTATVAQVWLYFRAAGAATDVAEYFEAAHVVLIYATVAGVVALLSRRLQAERAAVEQSLEELERTRDELVRRERLAATGRLASAIAHEIRNPIAMISSSLELARRGGTQALPAEELTRILEEETHRLERLTGDFLAYARQRPPEPSRVRVAELLGAAASLARARAATGDVRLAVEAAPGLGAELDPFQLQQALLNLLGNAIDAAPQGSEVRLVAGDADGTLAIDVENAGEAIGAEAAERIFEPFFSTKRGGTGLGLAITRAIAEAHGGSAALTHNEPGRVRFTLRFPAAVAAAPAPEVASPEVAWHAS